MQASVRGAIVAAWLPRTKTPNEAADCEVAKRFRPGGDKVKLGPHNFQNAEVHWILMTTGAV